MALDLTTTLTRTAGLLADVGNALWSVADLTNAVRLAVGEMSLAAGSVLTLNGLDGSAATTIPPLLENALVIGSAAYAASARQVDKADFEVLSEAKEITPWVVAKMADFRRMLGMQYPNMPESSGSGLGEAVSAWETARLAGLRSGTNPYTHWTDDFGEKGK